MLSSFSMEPIHESYLTLTEHDFNPSDGGLLSSRSCLDSLLCFDIALCVGP